MKTPFELKHTSMIRETHLTIVTLFHVLTNFIVKILLKLSIRRPQFCAGRITIKRIFVGSPFIVGRHKIYRSRMVLCVHEIGPRFNGFTKFVVLGNCVCRRYSQIGLKFWLRNWFAVDGLHM